MHEPLIIYIKNHSVTPLAEIDIKAIKDFFYKKNKKVAIFFCRRVMYAHTAFIVKRGTLVR